MKELIGHKIEGIFISKQESRLQFKTNKGVITYDTEAGCCSETWFADILNPEDIIGQTITEVDDSGDYDWCEVDETYSVDDGRTRQDYDSVYGYVLNSIKGSCDIIFRNSSNGYYGGSIYLKKDIKKIEAGAKEITQDWFAN